MAEKVKAIIMQLHPMPEQTYTEAQVKSFLYAFAHDLGCKWDDKELRDFIDTAFAV